VRSTMTRVLITTQAVVCLVATLGLGACGRSGVDSITGPSRDAASPMAKGQGNGGNVPPPPPPPVIVPPVAGAALKQITLTPTSVGGGTAAQGTVRLASNAPTGGVSVALSSGDATTAQVPSTVIVPSGQSRANFPISTVPVAANHTVSITATLNGASLSAPLTVQAPQLASVTLTPASVNAGGASQGTVTLSSPAVAPGAVVALASSLPGAASVTASVTIATGTTTATFAVTTPVSLTATNPIITGTLNGVARTATLAVAASDPCHSVLGLGGAAVLSDQSVAQFRTGRLRIDLTGDVAQGFINAMANCATAAAPTVSFSSGSAAVTMGGGVSATATGAPLAFGALAVPVPVEAGTVLTTDAAGNVLQVIWPALACGVAGPPVLRLNMAVWNPAVHAGTVLDAQLTFVARGADGSTATFTAHGTGMVVPTFVP